ncbi:hypothetical protein EWH08_07410 [Sphingobium indicum]|uniref:Uncharacterized protein n=2 Tax=Sphingobium indicum TaxID=332055 RepID=A0A1L5BNP8_SPHIB|nr:hypothetical protein [Sphingobium indicum]APL94531.1 hypothetical protein SIDU_08480 [Sphingobium indicum B90A]KEY97708.1 hypothetical protein AI27_16970 [Sphingomonas sp. BHC-A]NYI23337.1 hypothetical protein [Sphingobium indicum]RYM04281.1 hypothetical protein EWH08_07410 [Sphingobium indicum]
MNEAATGRPFRFFVLVMTGWIAIRLAGSEGDLPDAATGMIDEETFHPAAYSKNGAAKARRFGLPLWRDAPRAGPGAALLARPRRFMALSRPGRTMGANSPALAAKEEASTAWEMGKAGETAAPINPAPALPPASPPSAGVARWHGSAWLFWRDGSATRADAVTGGRLGGSQSGVRLDFDLTPQASSRATAYARASAALNDPASPEAALGLAWQPARSIAISFAAERRIALGKGGRNANAVLAVGGFGPTPLARFLEAEAYAQGGMVGFRSRDLFVDGKMSLLSPLGHSPVRIGGSLSGGAQPQVERLDIGPELQMRLPLKPAAARLSIEWRERVAGRAAPPSGLAVTLGADF